MIAIKGVEMPTACYICPLLDGEYGTCQIVGEIKVDMTEERAKNCPLVEIVTCKDCKYNKNGLCPDRRVSVGENSYCEDGKRRE